MTHRCNEQMNPGNMHSAAGQETAQKHGRDSNRAGKVVSTALQAQRSTQGTPAQLLLAVSTVLFQLAHTDKGLQATPANWMDVLKHNQGLAYCTHQQHQH